MESNRIIDLLESVDEDTKKKILQQVNDECSDENVKEEAVYDDNIKSLNGEDARLAKILAAAMKIAEERDPNYNKHTESEYELAGDADSAADRINITHKLVNGEISIEEAGTYLIDKAQCRLISFLEDAIDAGVPIIADKITSTLKNYCPSVAEYIPVIKESIEALCPGLKALVNVALNIGSEKAKKALPRVIERCQKVLFN